MYIVAIAWLYVVLMVSITQPSPLKGTITFIGAGLLPLALFLWLVGTPQRRRNREAAGREARAQADVKDAVARSPDLPQGRPGPSVDPEQ